MRKQSIHRVVVLTTILLAAAAVRCATHGAGERVEPATVPATPSERAEEPQEPAAGTEEGATEMGKDATPERSAIPDKYKWDTTHLFPSDAAWEKERKELVESFADIAKCKDKLGRSDQMVKTCLDRVFAARKRLERLLNYAHRLYDQDTREAKYQGYKQVIEKVATELRETTSFLQPELLALPAARLRRMMKKKAFSDYDQYLREMLRQKPHILSREQEQLLAAASIMRDSGYDIYSTFSGADIEFPTIKDRDGKPVQLTQSLFTKYRTSPSRRVRKDAFDAFFGTYNEYRNTIASMLASQVNANIVYAKARKYDSALEAALDDNNIPTAVYHNMIKAVNEHLPLLHRYLKLRQKLLGLKQLYYYDMYPPIVKKVELEYEYEPGRKVLAEALKPMGADYVKVLMQGLDPEQGWVDVYPNKGKRSGAYMDGSAYDVHPFVLTNYLDNYNSLSTLAHEMGHALHSYLSNKHQPFPKSDYSIFVAEVASTLNEALLMDYMLRKVEDPKKQLYLLGEKLEDFRQTVFRQSMFAEFELAVYERAEKKQPLTADQLTATYLDIARRYYGHASKVTVIDDLYGMEWAYVPHFYYNYYVFQYVTGMTAATALAAMIKKDGAKARDRYVENLLKAGNSDYSIELLKRAGVDLTTTKPYDVAMAEFKRALTRAEALVKKLEKGKGDE